MMQIVIDEMKGDGDYKPVVGEIRIEPDNEGRVYLSWGKKEIGFDLPILFDLIKEEMLK